MSRRRKSAFTPPSQKQLHHPLYHQNKRQASNVRKTIYKSKSLPDNLENVARKRQNIVSQSSKLFNKLSSGFKSICRTKSVSFQPEILLLTAVAEEDTEEVERLLTRNNVDVNYRTASGQSIMHYAAVVGSYSCMMLLIENGADIHVTDNAGKSPLDIAVRNGYFDCASELIKHGSKVERLVTGGDHW